MTAELKALQSRFLHSLVRQSEAVTGALAEPSRRRLSIYQSGYIARLRGNLEAVYPALKRHLGGAFFAALARGYIGRRPSRHFSLYDFGAGFAEFLVETQKGELGLDLPVDLARYEWALSQVSRAACWPDGPAFAGPAPDALAQAVLCAAGFQVNPSCQVLSLRHDVRALTATLRAGTPPEDAPAPAQEARMVSLAVWRTPAGTRCERLADTAAEILKTGHDGQGAASRPPDPTILLDMLHKDLIRPCV